MLLVHTVLMRGHSLTGRWLCCLWALHCLVLECGQVWIYFKKQELYVTEKIHAPYMHRYLLELTVCSLRFPDNLMCILYLFSEIPCTNMY